MSMPEILYLMDMFFVAQQMRGKLSDVIIIFNYNLNRPKTNKARKRKLTQRNTEGKIKLKATQRKTQVNRNDNRDDSSANPNSVNSMIIDLDSAVGKTKRNAES